MENYVVFRKDPNILELIDSVNFIVIVINRQLQLFWSFMCMIIIFFSQIVCLFLPWDQLRQSMRNRARFHRLRLDCIAFSVTFINRRLRRFWSFLCRSFIAIPHMFSTVLSLISCLFGVIKSYYFLLKSPSYQLRKSMNKQERFPLLKLDYVAIREVLNTLDPIDYINFSKASKSCRRLSAIKKPYEIDLTFKDFFDLRFWNGPFNTGIKWIEDKSISRIFRTRGDPLHAMKKLCLDARSLMGVEVDSVAIYMDDFGGQCRKIVDWLVSIRQEFSGFYIYGKNQRQEDVQYILDNLKIKDYLYTSVKTIEGLPLRLPETLNELQIRNGSWITLDYVMSLEMSRFSFCDTHLNNQEMNVIYKSWIDMESHQNLKSFVINIKDSEDFIAVALKDIPYRMGPRIRFPEYAVAEASFEVTRKDGLTAIICLCALGTRFDAFMLTSPFASQGETVPYIP
ncbi:unnamed protein product [Caenorhabditis nigoni]